MKCNSCFFSGTVSGNFLQLLQAISPSRLLGAGPDMNLKTRNKKSQAGVEKVVKNGQENIVRLRKVFFFPTFVSHTAASARKILSTAHFPSDFHRASSIRRSSHSARRVNKFLCKQERLGREEIESHTHTHFMCKENECMQDR